ncbi:MAG: DUF3419 family protein [Hyphomicrobiaceae bacterium]
MTLQSQILGADGGRLRAARGPLPRSVDALLERLFAATFSGLVYPQIWEDPEVDLEALALTPDSRVIAIASGGCNVLSYLAAGPAHITAVDLNAAHVALNRLKLAALAVLPDHAAFYRFFGHAAGSGNLVLYDRVLRPHLDPATAAYWDGRDALGRRRVTAFTRGFYRTGVLGRFIAMGHLLARAYGRDPRRLLAARTPAERHEAFGREIAPLFRKRLVRWLLSHQASLFGLGIPPAQYAALGGGGDNVMADVVRDRLRRLACDFPVDRNYFAWQAFARGYATDGAGPHPPYLDAANFAGLRARAGRVTVLRASMTDVLSRQPPGSLDRYVLLDAQDWMTDAQLAALWREITRTARPGARVIYRTAGDHPLLPGRVPASTLERWHYDEPLSRGLWRRDRSAIYGGFHLWRLAEGAS